MDIYVKGISEEKDSQSQNMSIESHGSSEIFRIESGENQLVESDKGRMGQVPTIRNDSEFYEDSVRDNLKNPTSDTKINAEKTTSLQRELFRSTFQPSPVLVSQSTVPTKILTGPCESSSVMIQSDNLNYPSSINQSSLSEKKNEEKRKSTSHVYFHLTSLRERNQLKISNDDRSCYQSGMNQIEISATDKHIDKIPLSPEYNSQTRVEPDLSSVTSVDLKMKQDSIQPIDHETDNSVPFLESHPFLQKSVSSDGQLNTNESSKMNNTVNIAINHQKDLEKSESNVQRCSIRNVEINPSTSLGLSNDQVYRHDIQNATSLSQSNQPCPLSQLLPTLLPSNPQTWHQITPFFDASVSSVSSARVASTPTINRPPEAHHCQPRKLSNEVISEQNISDVTKMSSSVTKKDAFERPKASTEQLMTVTVAKSQTGYDNTHQSAERSQFVGVISKSQTGYDNTHQSAERSQFVGVISKSQTGYDNTHQSAERSQFVGVISKSQNVVGLSSSSNQYADRSAENTQSRSQYVAADRSQFVGAERSHFVGSGSRSLQVLSSLSDQTHDHSESNSNDFSFPSSLSSLHHLSHQDLIGSTGRGTKHFIELLPQNTIHRQELDEYLNPLRRDDADVVGQRENDTAIQTQHDKESSQEDLSERLDHAKLILGLTMAGRQRTDPKIQISDVPCGDQHSARTPSSCVSHHQQSISKTQIFTAPQSKSSDSENRNFKCSVCDKRFKKKWHLSAHELRHNGEKPYHCSICSKSYIDSGTFNRHMKVHTGERDHLCRVCGKAFFNSGALTNHFKVHTGEKQHCCWICGKAFSHAGGLQVHVRSHTGERPYSCKECGKSFSKSSKLAVHARSHSGVKPYQCMFCNKSFSVSSNHKAHLRTHTGQRTFKCEICGKMFAMIQELEEHMSKHIKPPVFECKICRKMFLEADKLKEHETLHTGLKLYKCDMCTKEFKRSTNFKLHLKFHDMNKPFHCEVCGRDFMKYTDLMRHRKIHRNRQEFKCEICMTQFNLLITLQMHQLRVHGPEKSFKCSTCCRAFTRQADLKVHVRTHTGERPYRCRVCNQGFCGPGGLRKHLKKHPEEVGVVPKKEKKIYQCQICSQIFQQSSHLKAHVRRHTGEKPFECHFCSKFFTDVGMLNRHVKIHTGEKSHLCSVCGKGFIDSGSLHKHMNKHTDLKPYTCDICNKGFTFVGDLQVHKRSHTGEKPFKCPQCDKAFTKSSKLRVHSRIHSGEKPYTCNVCGKEFSVSSNLKTHMKTHNTVETFSCKSCGKTFNSEDLLQKHLQSSHSGFQPLQCDVCGQKFLEERQLQEHSFTHTGQKPFQCAICGKQFKKFHNYKSHIHVHNDVRPYSCDVCGRSFNKNGDLTNHLRSHNSQTGYRCEFCTEVFKHPADLRNHFVKFHSPDSFCSNINCDEGMHLSDIKYSKMDNSSECNFCNKVFSSIRGLKKHQLKCASLSESAQTLEVTNTVYSCGVCGQRFKHSDALQTHLLSHSLNKSQDNLQRASEDTIGDDLQQGSSDLQHVSSDLQHGSNDPIVRNVISGQGDHIVNDLQPVFTAPVNSVVKGSNKATEDSSRDPHGFPNMSKNKHTISPKDNCIEIIDRFQSTVGEPMQACSPEITTQNIIPGELRKDIGQDSEVGQIEFNLTTSQRLQCSGEDAVSAIPGQGGAITEALSSGGTHTSQLMSHYSEYSDVSNE